MKIMDQEGDNELEEPSGTCAFLFDSSADGVTDPA